MRKRKNPPNHNPATKNQGLLPPIHPLKEATNPLRLPTNRRGLRGLQPTVNTSVGTGVIEIMNDKDQDATASLCCDRCDGKHQTASCPYYKKERESHPDGQKNFYKKLGGESPLPGALLRRARVVRQPGDGSCLFHSMAYGLDGNGSSLRSQICTFIRQHPSFKINATPLSDWVKWDSGSSCAEYARRMSRGSWGGGIEMAVCSHLYDVNIHVYERSSLGYKRISAFDNPTSAASKNIVRVLYQGGVHYDALLH